MYLDTILATFSASLRSVLTACTMASMGFYLHRQNIIIGEGKRKLALISKKVTLPAFFFTNIVNCKQNWSHDPCPNVTDIIGEVWPLLFWPLYVVSCGFFIGWVVIKLTGTPLVQQKTVFVAIAFANSTGLPITLLTVIHRSFPSTSELGQINPTLFLSVYLLLYPVLQWGVGGYLLLSDNEEEPQEIIKMDIERALSYETLNSTFVEADFERALSYKSILSTTKTDTERVLSYNSLKYLEQNQDSYTELEALRKGVNLSPRTYSTIESRSSKDSTVTDSSYGQIGDDESIDMPFLYNLFYVIIPKCLQPPVIGALVGMMITASPLRGLFVDLVDRADKAPLEWLFDGMHTVGQAAIPINMMILGSNLSASQMICDSSKLLSPATMGGIVVGKMIMMPITGIISVILLDKFVWTIPEGVRSTFFLVSLIVFATPTANDVMVMIECGSNGSNEGSKEGIARVFGLQYLCAPILLSLSVTVIVSIATNF